MELPDRTPTASMGADFKQTFEHVNIKGLLPGSSKANETLLKAVFLVFWKTSFYGSGCTHPPWQEGWSWMIFKVPYKPSHSMILFFYSWHNFQGTCYSSCLAANIVSNSITVFFSYLYCKSAAEGHLSFYNT